jgi:hypothetical protein
MALTLRTPLAAAMRMMVAQEGLVRYLPSPETTRVQPAGSQDVSSLAVEALLQADLQKCTAPTLELLGRQCIESGLHEVLQVVFLLEHSDLQQQQERGTPISIEQAWPLSSESLLWTPRLLSETARARLLAVYRFCGNHFHGDLIVRCHAALNFLIRSILRGLRLQRGDFCMLFSLCFQDVVLSSTESKGKLLGHAQDSPAAGQLPRQIHRHA